MRDREYRDFVEAMDAACEQCHRPSMGGAGKALMFRALADVSMEDFGRALTAHLNDEESGKYAPTAAHIRAQLSKFREADGRPSAEEAWATAISAQDEAVTVVLNDDISAALGVCRPILDVGDEVGARMAFKEAYARIVREARVAGAPARWFPSLGRDPQGREQALLEAYRLNRLPREQVAGLLPSVPSRSSLKALPPAKSAEEVLSREQISEKIDGLIRTLQKKGSSPIELVREEEREWESARRAELAEQVEMLKQRRVTDSGSGSNLRLVSGGDYGR